MLVYYINDYVDFFYKIIIICLENDLHGNIHVNNKQGLLLKSWVGLQNNGEDVKYKNSHGYDYNLVKISALIW